MQLIKYEPFTGDRKEILESHEKSKDICLKYTIEDLKQWKTLDLYFLLGIGHLRDDQELNQTVLLFMYKKQIKKYHPDGTGYPKEAFMAIKKAYEILGDPVLRKQYDSMVFVDNIPLDRRYEDADFYKIFGDCFYKNAKFSIAHPVPILGRENTPREEVEKFYKFWNNFQSWRSFEMLDAEDATMCRYEKRNREKLHKNKWIKLKNEDCIRIKKLVSIALKRDPRLNEKKQETVDEKLLAGGWEEEEIIVLCKLLNEIKVGEKNRFDVIAKKLTERTSVKRNPREIFLKANQIQAIKK